MQLTTMVARSYPKLGYYGTVSGTTVELRHGDWVEVHGDRFSDGAWSGDFARDPTQSNFLTGTVGMIAPDGLRVLVSQALFDRVFVHETTGCVHFSNSLPLILAALDDELDPDQPFYRSRFMAAEMGVSLAPRTFRTRHGRTLRLILSETATIRPGGVETSPRLADPPFRSFEQYRATLADTTAAVIANAQDDRRQHPFAALPTISAGYDSSVVAVLSAEAGCAKALTMLRYDESDSTELVDFPGEVASTLGLELIEVERDQWRSDGVEPSALVAASGVTLMDVVMLTYGDHLSGKLLIVGIPGDNVWSKSNFRAYHDIVQGFGALSGRGLAEHRLRLGYSLFAIPYIGHTAHPSLFELSNDDSMVPWSVGGDYDRPIARRIVEEAGVARDAFALRKYAGSARVGSSRTRNVAETRAGREAELAEVMTPAAARSFLDFVEDQEAAGHGLASTRVQWILRVGPTVSLLYQKLDALNYRIGRLLHRFGIKAVVPRRLMVKLAAVARATPDYTYLLPHWGTEVMKSTYQSER